MLVGLNAVGKSNILDALRFVRDALVHSPARALSARGGLDSVLRRSELVDAPEGRDAESSEVAESFAICLEVGLGAADGAATYELEIGRDPAGEYEHLVLRETCVLHRPEGDSTYTTDLGPDRRRYVQGGIPGAELGVEELLLPVVGRLSPYATLLNALVAPRFYELDTSVLRALDETKARRRWLGEHGEHLGQVLGSLARDYPSFKEVLDGYMRALIPSILGVDERLQGDYATIQSRFWMGDPVVPYWTAVASGTVGPGDPHVRLFQREQLSEGTVRAAGVLAALLQPGVLTGDIPLVAIEEPEIAIHPSRVGALFDALLEASQRTQVIATTQSSDFLDTEEFTPSALRVVEMANGATVIGELDSHTQRYLSKDPSQVAEMHRQGQLRPADPEGEER
ncbi:AAA family ATPase [Sphaerisporangium aureirubrum]|uniref:AAA family ATPase n=1 Tax=Sphaerisporangium aureirubrum TaxID=1544736 RepID=A0ABW1NRK9_9ACTN